jgi:hypothetical protein
MLALDAAKEALDEIELKFSRRLGVKPCRVRSILVTKILEHSIIEDDLLLEWHKAYAHFNHEKDYWLDKRLKITENWVTEHQKKSVRHTVYFGLVVTYLVVDFLYTLYTVL